MEILNQFSRISLKIQEENSEDLGIFLNFLENFLNFKKKTI